MPHGFLYLMAILDVASRKVLAWRLSNTLMTRFSVEAFKEAMRKYGRPEFFNVDQGSQFTSDDGITPIEATRRSDSSGSTPPLGLRSSIAAGPQAPL